MHNMNTYLDSRDNWLNSEQDDYIREYLKARVDNIIGLKGESQDVEKISTAEYNSCVMPNWMIWYVQFKSLLQKKWLRVE